MKIQIYSYFHIPYGSIPIVSSEWIKVLRAAGHDVKVHDYFFKDYRFDFVKELVGDHNPYRKDTLAIFFGFPSYVNKISNLVFKHRNKIGVFVTETDLSEKERNALKEHYWTKIAVPSNYCRGIFSQHAHTGEILVVPHGIHPEFLEDSIDVPRREKFTFLFIFNTSLSGGSIIRKNLGNLLSAFRSFREKHDCSLLVKSPSNIEANVPVIESENPGVKFDLGLYSPRDLIGLYRSCHAYVNVSRAEGFGMTALEAMALGVPVASPNHSGLGDFINENNAVVIPSAKSKENFKYATNDWLLWDVPVTDIMNAMARLYSENEVLTRRAKEYSGYVKTNYSWSECLRGIKQWITSLST